MHSKVLVIAKERYDELMNIIKTERASTKSKYVDLHHTQLQFAVYNARPRLVQDMQKKYLTLLESGWIATFFFEEYDDKLSELDIIFRYVHFKHEGW